MSQVFPKNPGKALGSAQYAGLAALVRLAKRRVTKDVTVQSMFAGIDRMWRDVKTQVRASSKAGLKDLTPLFNAEPNMRKNYLGMHWYSTVPYGNTEFKRVYRWSEGTVGPLNELYSFAGAQLRTLAMTQFPFPTPTFYQVREYSDETTKTLSKSTAFKYPAEDDVKTKWIAVYPGSSGHADVRIRHPTLPELDFVDMIRAHIYELCRQCFIHNVPRNAVRRYIRLLIHQLTPFLEWKYTSGDSGKKDFWPQADRELRKIVLDLRAVYSRRSGGAPRLTRQLADERPKSVSINVFKDQAKLALPGNNSKAMKHTVRNLRKHIKQENITDHDAASLVEDALRISAAEGNRWHSVIANSGYQPNSLAEAIFYGDKHHRERSGILIAHEVPVTTPKGKGVADIVVFVRRVYGERVIWTPVMVLDLKTKTQLDWTFFSMKPRTKKAETRIFVHDIRKRTLSDDEWKSVLGSTPSMTHMTQLREYESGILSGFEELVHDKEILPKSLWKGIIALDSEGEYKDLVDIIPWLIKASIADLEESTDIADSRVLYTLDSTDGSVQSLRLALILSSKKGPLGILKNRLPVTELYEENPFELRKKDEVNFTLYLSARSAGTPGSSAAWTARNWHLLEYLRQLVSENDTSKIIWLDLMGSFPSVDLAMSRLRIRGGLSPKGLPRKSLQKLRALVKRIEFVNTRDELLSYLFEEKRAVLEQLREKLDLVLAKEEGKQVIIVDGWSEICNITPSRLDTLMRTLEQRLLEWLPKMKAEIIWLDSPVPLPTRSSTYQLPETSPLPHDSPRRELLDMIIWNKPTPPRFFGWKSPVLEYVRVIEQDTSGQAKPLSALFLVPHLHGWGRRFRADSSEGIKLTDSDIMEHVHGPKYARGSVSSTSYSYDLVDESLQKDVLWKSLTLSPSILRAREEGRVSLLFDMESTDKDLVLSTRKVGKVKSSKGILDRLSLVPSEIPSRETRKENNKAERLYSADAITRARRYRKRREPKQQSRWTRRPPLLKAPPKVSVSEEEYRLETLRLLRTARFLRRKASAREPDWRRFLNDVINLCKSGIKLVGGKKKPADVLQDVKDLLMNDKESKEIWNLLSDVRKESLQTAFMHVSESTSDENLLWDRFGNDLYLLILGISRDSVLEEDKPSLELLWLAHSDWQLVHMGHIQYDQPAFHVKSKYDISSIWSNLKWRARRLAKVAPIYGVFEAHRFGLLEQVDGGGQWLVFQERASQRPMIAGFTEDHEGPLRWRWYGCVLDPFQLAEQSSKSWEQSIPIVITQIEGKEILWTPRIDHDEITSWWAEGVFEYGPPPKERIAPLRWFRLSRIPDSLRTRLIQPEMSVPDGLDYAVKQTLEQLDGLSEDIKRVDCKVTVDTIRETYQIQFMDKEVNESESVFVLDIENTNDLIQTLRYPKVKGSPFKDEFWWNPESDIKFTQVETENGLISLTFLKPFLYRSRKGSKFLKNLILPKNARDLLLMKLGQPIALVADPDLKRKERPLSRCWRILFLQTETSVRIEALQNIDLNIFEVAQFFECKQFIDTGTGLRHPVKFAVNNANKVRFPEEIFSYNEISTYLSERGIHADSGNDSEYPG